MIWIWLGICLTLIYLMSRWGRYAEGILMASLIIACSNLDFPQILELGFKALTQQSNLQLIAAVGLISIFNSGMSYYGHLEVGIPSLGIPSRLRSAAFPLILGMFPVPGGAMLSAPYIDPELPPQTKTFLNVWYRHLIFLVYPYAPALILATSISGLSLIQFLIMNSWIFGLGLLIGLSKLGSGPKFNKHDIHLNIPGIMRLSPLLVAVVGLSLGLIPGLILGLICCLGLGRFRHPIRAMSKEFDPRLVISTLGIVLFKEYLTGILELNSVQLIPPEAQSLLGMALISFGLGLLTGVDILAVGLALGLSSALIQDPIWIWILYLYALFGYIISPLHLCLILSCRYFRSGLISSYREFWIPYLIVLGAPWTGAILLKSAGSSPA